jgi:glyoxalase family protein
MGYENCVMALEQKDQGVLGIHHVTAIARNPQKNFEFYTGILGLRLVKLTVNFDDPTTYHLYYGDEIGRPGTILTFFPWEHIHQGWRGTGEVVTISFSIPENAIAYWCNRFKAKGVEHSEPKMRFGNSEQAITFYDEDGLKLELVANKEAENIKTNIWQKGHIPADYSIRGLHSVTLSLDGYDKTASLLTNEMGFSKTGHEGNRFRFQIKDKYNEKPISNLDGNDDNGPNYTSSSPSSSLSSIVDIACLPYAQPGRMGAGSVHHVAWRTPTDQSQLELRKKIIGTRLNPTPVIDRLYFHSVYFREPGGVLFEIATDPPGFAIDQKPDDLGQKLVLPKWLEPKREYIEKTLPPINISKQEKQNFGDNLEEQ